jgi:enoyl-CoA hydratase
MAEGRGRIGVPELLVGVPFPALALEIVRFAAGARTQELAFTGKTYSPDEAKSIGIVDEVIPADALEAKALEAATRLAAIPRDAFRLAKMQLRRPFVEAADRAGGADAEALALWSDPRSHAHIREYLAKTIKK